MLKENILKNISRPHATIAVGDNVSASLHIDEHVKQCFYSG